MLILLKHEIVFTKYKIAGVKMVAAYKTGELDPSSCLGFATITEYVVMDVLGDATKENFGSSYDLISESLGKINVKCSALRSYGQTRRYWHFSKRTTAKIPDYYICLGMDKHQTEILKTWVIPGNSKVVTVKGITISPRREERVKRYATDPTIYNKTFQEMDIKTKPEFSNTTKPKINETNLIIKKWDQEYQEALEAMKHQPPSRNHIMFECIQYSAPLQKLVLLGIAWVATKHKLPLDYRWVINYCLDLGRKYDFSYASFRNVGDSIGSWGDCGVIKVKYPKIKAINADLDDIIDIILQDPEFTKFKEEFK